MFFSSPPPAALEQQLIFQLQQGQQWTATQINNPSVAPWYKIQLLQQRYNALSVSFMPQALDLFNAGYPRLLSLVQEELMAVSNSISFYQGPVVSPMPLMPSVPQPRFSSHEQFTAWLEEENRKTEDARRRSVGDCIHCPPGRSLEGQAKCPWCGRYQTR